jgi:hypothetical protein
VLLEAYVGASHSIFAQRLANAARRLGAFRFARPATDHEIDTKCISPGRRTFMTVLERC